MKNDEESIIVVNIDYNVEPGEIAFILRSSLCKNRGTDFPPVLGFRVVHQYNISLKYSRGTRLCTHVGRGARRIRSSNRSI